MMFWKKRISLLDGGAGALAVASGQSAITLALFNIAQAGDEIVSADNLYGGTYNLFHYTLARLGIKVKFVKSNDWDALQKAITPKTKAVYAESIGNPKLDVADLEGISKVAHKNGIPFVLNNTVSPSPRCFAPRLSCESKNGDDGGFWPQMNKRIEPQA